MTTRRPLPRPGHEPALEAVARVRGVREQQTLIDLQRALTLQREREAELARLEGLLEAAGDIEASILTAGSPGELLGLRMTVVQLGESIRTARTALAEARAVTDAARQRWEHDHSRLRAVEELLLRRADSRTTEIGRKVAREQDDLAAQGWLRRTTLEGHA